MIDPSTMLLGMLIGALGFSAYMAGRRSHNLARMEIAAAVGTAKQEVGWTYERYRLESLRMDWVALPSSARAEYRRSWGEPTWSRPSTQKADPMADVAKVRGR